MSNKKEYYSLWNLIWQRKYFIILTVFIISSVTVGLSFFLPKWYKSRTVILAPTSDGSALGAMSAIGNLGLNVGGIFGSNENMFRYITILNSRTLQEKVVEKFNLKQKYECEYIEDATQKLSENLTNEIGDENQLIINMLDTDQKKVDEMLNYVLFCLDSININLSTSRGKLERKFMEGRIEMVMDSIRFYGNKLAEFQKDKNILSIPDQVKIGVENIALLQSQVMIKEIEYKVALKSLKENDPRLIVLKEELNLLQKKFNEQENHQNTSNVFLDLEKIPEWSVKIEEYKRKIEYYTTLLRFLGPQYEQSILEERKDISTFQILDRPNQPNKKAKPKRLLILIAAMVLSTLISMYYVYWREIVKDKKLT